MKKIIATTNAPAAIGPYSQAIDCGSFLVTSGQVPFDPATGEFVPGGITEQTRQVLPNIKAILEAAGLTMDNVVKTTVFLQSMGDFAAMNAVYAEFFTEGQYPARSAVEVGALPRGALVEIETICVKKSMRKARRKAGFFVIPPRPAGRWLFHIPGHTAPARTRSLCWQSACFGPRCA